MGQVLDRDEGTVLVGAHCASIAFVLFVVAIKGRDWCVAFLESSCWLSAYFPRHHSLVDSKSICSVNGLHLPATSNTGNKHLRYAGRRCELGGHLCYSNSGGAIKLRDCVVDGSTGGLIDLACCFSNTGLHVIAHVFVVWSTFAYPYTSRRCS